ncbi:MULTISPECIES: helix-turn-helix domain-containing protein [Psychrobacillus]|uniref:Helix-turn-helix transcriptional regulator n=1 Tax=Psychrobacillus faecigallinarum TaxID=2762235 RepID=A0ABR8RD94_9BACI|nr:MULTISPECIES: helix-turn-helix transcriptional regulator [Psychrobacillus]MBD7945704.1 helix-turn-helix transcriptional regulator [Psychrobacillus faecigallinarum]QEY22566.1 XRE family transcriptional regulator [Psychrobacillus sp. AK 1817]QGM29434.1 helix-turn-helix domain-containing protein [Bacillus sp. N3536]
MKKELHKQLRQLREERNISLETLSLKTRIGAGKLEAYESGSEIPSTQTILKLSNALEVPASNLMDGLQEV